RLISGRTASIKYRQLWFTHSSLHNVHVALREDADNNLGFQDASLRYRYADTSLQIHRQWQHRQLQTFPSVAAADTVAVSRLLKTFESYQSKLSFII
ncbi:hypothetical protein C0J52_02871, partial [Blattella germanica]